MRFVWQKDRLKSGFRTGEWSGKKRTNQSWMDRTWTSRRSRTETCVEGSKEHRDVGGDNQKVLLVENDTEYLEEKMWWSELMLKIDWQIWPVFRL